MLGAPAVLSAALLACVAGVAALDGPGPACRPDAQEATEEACLAARPDGDLLLLQKVKSLWQRAASSEPSGFDVDFIHDSHNTLEAYTEANGKEEAAEQARQEAAGGAAIQAQQAPPEGKAAPIPPASLSHVGGVSATSQVSEAAEAAPNASDATLPATPSANATSAPHATSAPAASPAAANTTVPIEVAPDLTNVSNQSVPPAASPPAVVAGCATRHDERIEAWLRVTAEPGTPCLFGVDARDEGKHCIMDNGEFGSYGWCWTTADKGEWGSCNEQCPLFGQAKALAKKVDAVSDVVGRIVEHVAETSGGAAPTASASLATPEAQSNEVADTAAATPSKDPKVSFF